MSLRELSWSINATGTQKAISEVNKMDNAVTGLSGSMKGASSNIEKMEKLGKGMTGLGKDLTKKVTVPIVGAGAAAVKTVMGFDDSMSKVRAIVGNMSQNEFEQLRKKAQELGSTTAHTASQAADGMGILAASGMETNDILATSEHMLNLMSAGAISAETSASILTNTMAQFNMSADESGRIADIFASGASNAKVSVEQLEYAMSVAGGAMATTNMTAEQSVAAIGQLANAGTPINQIGTTLNAMTREMKANADKFKNLGIDVYDPVTGSIKDMGSVMAELEVATKGMTNEQRDAALATIFSGQSIKGVIGWLNQGSDAYDELTGSIEGSQGAAGAMAAEMEDNIGGAFRSLRSAIEGLMIELGDVFKDDIKAIAEGIADFARKISNMDERTKQVIGTIAGVAAAAGPVLLIGGKLLSGIAGVPSKIETAKSAFGILAGAMNPVTLAIGLVVIAGIALYKNWDTIKEKAAIVAGFVSEKWSALVGIFENVKGKVADAADTIVSKWNNIKEKLKNPITGTVSLVRKGVGWVGEKMGFDGTHATGLNYVPKDNYVANLHQGEMVLTRRASQEYRSLGGTRNSVPSRNKTTFHPTVVVNVQGSSQDGQSIADAVRVEMSKMFREWQLQEV